MWLLDVRSPPSDAEYRCGARQLAFDRTRRNFFECAFIRSQHGFHEAVGALVLICVVAKCGHDLLFGARRWIPQPKSLAWR